ncbi:MAG: transglutaminase domain-containing protein, partial [Methanobacteriaceae archaeon]|nr:transglutaminase domain-containing protein [Methanobacteriaceae archaeon]
TQTTQTIQITSSSTKLKTTITTINEGQFYKNKYIQVKLTDANGKAIPNVTLYMTFQTSTNKKTYKFTTDKNGQAKAEVTLTQNYNVTFEFKETSKYLGTSKKVTVIKELSLATIKTASANLKESIESSGKVPTGIKIGSVTYTMDEFLYLMTKAVININNGDNSAIKIKAISTAPNPTTKELKGEIQKSEIIKISKNLLNFMNSNSRSPNYLSSSLGNIPYAQMIHMYAKILEFDKREKRLCNYVTLVSLKTFKPKTTSTSTTKSTTTQSSKYTKEELAKYLSESTNCQCNNAAIEKLADSLTGSLNDITEKATAVYNYVRDKISYSSYNNTKKGAVKTLNDKSGNCVDQAHLLVALARASGIPARYVHGTNCKFTSGLVCGHVWVQLLINDVWVVADPTSQKNSLGTIKNWNTASYTLKGTYSSLSF